MIELQSVGRFVLVLLVAIQTCQAANGPETRLLRMIASNKEPIRMQGIASLQAQPEMCLANRDRLIQIAKSESTSLGPKQEVRPSLADLLNLIGSINQPDAEQALIELLDAKNGEVAMMTAHALGLNRCLNALEPMKKQTE